MGAVEAGVCVACGGSAAHGDRCRSCRAKGRQAARLVPVEAPDPAPAGGVRRALERLKKAPVRIGAVVEEEAPAPRVVTLERAPVKKKETAVLNTNGTTTETDEDAPPAKASRSCGCAPRGKHRKGCAGNARPSKPPPSASRVGPRPRPRRAWTGSTWRSRSRSSSARCRTRTPGGSFASSSP